MLNYCLDAFLGPATIISRKPILAFYGHHKCGTTWILGILGDVCQRADLKLLNHHYEQFFDGDIRAFQRQHPFDLWCYTNADYAFVRPLDTIGFHVVRDPRDVVVSAYFSHLNSHPDAGWPRLRWYRPYLRTLSKDEGLIKEMEFCGIFLNQMLSWDYNANPSILEFRFEDMIASPADSFQIIFKHLGLLSKKVQPSVVQSIIAKYSFERLSGGRQPGHEDTSSHYRKGVPGDWRNHLTKRHIAYFKALYNPLLLKLGYEEDDAWE